jgi:transposase
MEIVLTAAARAALEQAAATEGRTRRWKRYQAVLLVADGVQPDAVAATLGCGRSSVYGWAAAYRTGGVDALAEGPHVGAARKLDDAGETLLTTLIADDPQAHGHRATGWTVPLLRTELAAAGITISAKTLRRALHRLGYRWKRPKYVLGRPDPAYEEKRGSSWPRSLACSAVVAKSGSRTRRPCANTRRYGRAGAPGAPKRPW